jgi:hypothetical protein
MPESKAVMSAPAEEAEQKHAGESDPSETEAKEDEQDEIEEESGEESEESKSDGKDEKPRKKGGFQRRIDKLNARISERERELEYWKKLAATKAEADAATEEPKVETKQASQDGKPTKPRLGEFESFEAYEEAQAEYVEKLADWKLEQREKAREAEANQKAVLSEQEKLQKAHVERVKAFAEKTEDFHEALEGLDGLANATVEAIILQSDNGPELLYALAKDPEEAKRICSLGPVAAAMEMGLLKARLKPASDEKKPEPKKLTKAPKPLEPVNAGGKGTVRKSIDDPDLSFQDYERIRREQQMRRRG